MKLTIIFAAAAAVLSSSASALHLKSRELYCSQPTKNLNAMFISENSLGEKTPSEFCQWHHVGHACFLQGASLGERIPGKCVNNVDDSAFDGACYCQALESGQRYLRPLADRDAVEERDLDDAPTRKCIGASANADEMTYDTCEGEVEGTACKLQEPGTQVGAKQRNGVCTRATDRHYHELSNCYCRRVETKPGLTPAHPVRVEFASSTTPCTKGASECSGQLEGGECGKDMAGKTKSCRRVNSMYGACHCLE